MARKSRIKRRKSRKTNKRAKTHKRSSGGQPGKVKCCMCDTEIQREDGLMPAKCYRKNGAQRAHRICQECWWSRFAKEDANHACPGCVKGLPLNGPPIDYSQVVEISD
jgi:hypothetical protein